MKKGISDAIQELWASLINRKFAAALILSKETLDCRVTFRDIAHRNEPKASRVAGFAIHNQFNFRNSAERLKEFPQCAFCSVKGKDLRRKARW